MDQSRGSRSQPPFAERQWRLAIGRALPSPRHRATLSVAMVGVSQVMNPLFVWPIRIVLVAALLYAAGTPVADGQTTSSVNKYNDELLKLSAEEQAAKLAEHLGLWCIGTKPFLMGVTKEGPAAGYAYWSIQCAGGQSYMVQIAPDGKGAAIDCQTLKENGEGRECYKRF